MNDAPRNRAVDSATKTKASKSAYHKRCAYRNVRRYVHTFRRLHAMSLAAAGAWREGPRPRAPQHEMTRASTTTLSSRAHTQACPAFNYLGSNAMAHIDHSRTIIHGHPCPCISKWQELVDGFMLISWSTCSRLLPHRPQAPPKDSPGHPAKQTACAATTITGTPGTKSPPHYERQAHQGACAHTKATKKRGQ
jgi:hypothetical protein